MILTDLPAALAHLADIEALLEGRAPAVFLDFDGTLAPIAARPDLARISASMRACVEALAAVCPVGIVSGRDRSVVEDLVGLENVCYAGSHGFDISIPGGKIIRHQVGGDFAPLMAELHARLAADLKDIEGVVIEAKAVSLAVHFRQVRNERQKDVAVVVGAVLDAHPKVKALRGKMVVELLPRIDWDKGRAVAWLLEALHLGDSAFPVFLGDDITDESAFRALKDRESGGVGIFVAETPADLTPRATDAGYLLNGVDEVEVFLRRLLAAL